MMDGHRNRLNDLEGPIADAVLMASITTKLGFKFYSELRAYRNVPNMPASRMADELDEGCEELQFAIYRLEEMLRELKAAYLAPIGEVAA